VNAAVFLAVFGVLLSIVTAGAAVTLWAIDYEPRHAAPGPVPGWRLRARRVRDYLVPRWQELTGTVRWLPRRLGVALAAFRAPDEDIVVLQLQQAGWVKL
jgi:hypothetical protein